MSIWKSIKGLFGQTIHYKDGQYAGESWDGLIPGSQNHYDANGQYVGYSDPGFFADHVHHKADGTRIGETWTDDFGVSRHYSETDGRIGTSYDGFVGRTSIIDDASDALLDSDSDIFSGDSFGDSDW